MIKCPICEKGTLIKTKEKEVFYGVNLGVYPTEKCNHCKETFTDGVVMERIEQKAKEKGVWGFGKKTQIEAKGYQ